MTAAAASESTHPSEGRGWVIFAGVVLCLAGLMNVADGLWAFNHDETRVDTLLYSSNLTVWGWIYLIAGLLLLAVGVALFFRFEWALWTGVLAAFFGVLLNFLWAFAFPIPSLILVGLNLLVIYGLAVKTPETSAFRERG